jgi:WS/DGAT/MGAT family acyltransferase
VPWLSRQPLRAARAAAQNLRSVVQRARSRDDERIVPPVTVAHSWLNAPITAQRSIAYATLRLDEVKAVGRAADATVNDVLLAVVGSGLRRYLETRGVLPAEPLVAAVPLASRTEGDTRANAVTSVNVGLGTDLSDPQERLRMIRDATAAAKQSRGHTLGDDLGAWADVPPPFVFSLVSRAYVELGLAERLPSICNLIVSSVPGPPVPLYLAGCRLVGIHPLGPIFSGMLLNITAMGGVDSIDLGLVACRGRMPDLWDLSDASLESLAELAEAGDQSSRPSAAAATLHGPEPGRGGADEMRR